MTRRSRRRLPGLASLAAVTVLIASLLASSPAIGADPTLDEALRASDAVVVARPADGSTDTDASLRLEVQAVLLGSVQPGDRLTVRGAPEVPGPGVWFLALAPDGVFRCAAPPRRPGWSDEVAAALPASGLRLRLNRHWFRRGEPVVVHLELHNRGHAPAAFPGLWRDAEAFHADLDLPLSVHRIQGDAEPPVDVRPVVARRLAAPDAAVLEPGERALLALQLEDFADLGRTGLYRLRLEAGPEWGAAEARLFVHP